MPWRIGEKEKAMEIDRLHEDEVLSLSWIRLTRGTGTQRKNLIDFGHDLGNRDQDKVDPGQESRFLARMAKILLINFFTLLVKRNPTAIAI